MSVMRTRRSGKAAGLGALSALTVARRRRRRVWPEVRAWELDWERSADLAMLRCAREGGLKEESRT